MKQRRCLLTNRRRTQYFQNQLKNRLARETATSQIEDVFFLDRSRQVLRRLLAMVYHRLKSSASQFFQFLQGENEAERICHPRLSWSNQAMSASALQGYQLARLD